MPAGRPTDYRPEFAEQAKIMCEAGATNAELAEEFGVTVPTIQNWKLKHPEFFAAIKLNKPLADERVERSLFERANGYSYNAVKIFCNKDGKITEVPYVEHVLPDPTAMIFWLKNRKPAEWRDRKEFSGPNGGAIPIANLSAADFTDEQLASLIAGKDGNAG